MIYPDLYDVGMSYYGFQILYHLLNREDDIIADRAYAPWVDFEEKLRENSLFLYGLETKTPLKNFDMLGFTLPYELTYTNILNILDLAGIPVQSGARSDDNPIVIAGGSGAYNPEPVVAFFDLFVIGDAEDIVVPLVRFINGQRSKQISRTKILKRAVQKFSGLYFPGAYRREPIGNNGFLVPVTQETGVPQKVTARRISKLEAENFPLQPLIPVVEIAQDRLVAEIMRGCTQGCRFCQAGMIYRPVRERNPQELRLQIEESLQKTGYDNVSLLSLSSSDYCGIGELIDGLSDVLERERIALSLPSLRLDSFSESLAMTAQMTRKSGLTFAPEAGSEYLRWVINKNISEKDLLQSVDLAIKYGWRLIKLYFMLGLPLEKDTDLDEIIRLTKAVYARGNRRLSINITLSTFIPKPFTPFQWEGQDSSAEIQRKIDRIKQGLSPYKKIKIMARDPLYSQLEGAISRGDSRISKVIYSAWKGGAKFDSWREFFKPGVWEQAFAEHGLQMQDLTECRSVTEPLPWDVIDARVTKEFLADERTKAYRGATSPDCRRGCIGCGVCDFENLSMDIVKSESSRSVASLPVAEKLPRDLRTVRYRLNYFKEGPARFISHLDTMRLFRQVFRQVGLKMSFTEGYHRRPKMSSGFPLPLGYASRDEYLDVTVQEKAELSMDRINRALPEGFGIKSVSEISKGPSIFSGTTGFEYELSFSETLPPSIDQVIQQLLGRAQIMIEKLRRQEIRRINVRPFISTIVKTDAHRVQIATRVINGQTVRPEELLTDLSINERPVICRLKTHLENKEQVMIL